MDEDVAMALLHGGVPAADAHVGDLNVVLGKVADGRELLRQKEARGLVAGGCRERELESERAMSKQESRREQAGRPCSRRRFKPPRPLAPVLRGTYDEACPLPLSRASPVHVLD